MPITWLQIPTELVPFVQNAQYGQSATTLWKQSADNGLETLLVPVGCAPISAYYYLQLHWEALYLFILAKQLLVASSASISIVWKYKFTPCFALFLLVDNDAIGNLDEEVDLVTSSNKRLLNGGCCGWSPEAAGTIIWQQKPFVYWLINFSIGRFLHNGSVCTNTRTLWQQMRFNKGTTQYNALWNGHRNLRPAEETICRVQGLIGDVWSMYWGRKEDDRIDLIAKIVPLTRTCLLHLIISRSAGD